MKKKISILLGIGLSALTLSLCLLPAGRAAGQQVGDNFTVIVTADKLTDANSVLVVKSAKAAKKVGDCAAKEVNFVDGELVSRDGKAAPVAVEAAIIIPGVSEIAELKPGWRVGSFRAGGKCGPGYDAFLAHVIALK